MNSRLRDFNDNGLVYTGLMFACPGCASFHEGYDGIHILPVNLPSGIDKVSWDWDGDLENPTLSPSILSTYRPGDVCHSFLTAGVFRFLEDSTHVLAGQEVVIPPLPDWAEALG